MAPVRQLCRTSPKSVVQMMRTIYKPNDEPEVQRNQGESVAVSLKAVGELVKEEPVSEEKLQTWRKLVDAGIIDALIFNVLSSTNIVQFSPDMPEELKEKILTEVCSFSARYQPKSDSFSICGLS